MRIWVDVTGGEREDPVVRTPFVGREEQRAAGTRMLEGARVGKPRPLLITGEPGAGKTSLLREIASDARRSGFRTIEIAVDVVDADVPYAAFRLALEPELDGELAPALAVAATSLAAALAASVDRPSSMAISGGMPELLRRMFTGWASRQPVIVAVDDLHAADADTTSAVLYLMRHLRHERVLIAATTRVDPPDLDPLRADTYERLRGTGAIEVMSLGALDDDELRLLVQARTGEPPSPQLLTTLAERTGGNPFFAVELLEGLEASGALVRRDGHIGVADVPGPALPRRVTTAVLHRVFQLGADARKVASVASLFPSVPLHRLPLLQTLCGLGGARCASAFDLLVSAHVLVGGDDRYHFSHAIVREALCDDLGPATRQRLHEQAATLLSEANAGGMAEVLEIARHVRYSRTRLDTHAAALLAAAGDAMANPAPHTAVGWYQDALARLPLDDPAAAHVRVELGRALTFSGRHVEAARVATEAAAMLEPGHGRVRAVLVAAHGLFAAGRLDAAGALLDEALADAAQPSAKLLVQRAYVSLWQQQLEDARRALADAGDVEPTDQTSMADVVAMHLAAAEGNYGGAMELARRLRTELTHAPADEQSSIRVAVCMTTAFNGDPRVAVADAEQIEQLGAMSPWFRACAAWALYRLGRWDDAVRHAESARGEIDAATGDLATSLFVPVLIAVHAERGDAASAQSALELARLPAGRLFEAGVDWAASLLHTTRGEHQRALAVLDAAARREVKTGRINFLALILGQAAEVAWRAGDRDAARKASEQLQSLPCDEAGVAATMWCQLTRALVATDADAAAEARALALRHELMADAGRALGLLGSIRDDAAMLVEAYDELDRLGAVHRQRELSQHLRRLGKRAPRRRNRANQLTPTEAQIANLVGAGLTNRQIASEARLSPKTVEVYLSRIYTKTGCRSRVDLAVAVNTGQIPGGLNGSRHLA